LLVPYRHYAIVTRHVEANRIRDERGRGQRLIYLRVTDRSAPQRPKAAIHAQSLLRKLRHREGHPLLPWLKVELEDRFDYLCCDTIEQFQAAQDLAVTRERHVKTRGIRHEKDDRERATDPRNFVLGWDNREKRRHLAAEIERRNNESMELDRYLARADTELSRVEGQRLAITELQGINEFSMLDYAAEENAMTSLFAEKAALEAGNETIQLLRQRLKSLELSQMQLQDQRDALIRSQQELTTNIQFGQGQKNPCRTVAVLVVRISCCWQTSQRGTHGFSI
jgi:uncharacterized protein YPO0396